MAKSKTSNFDEVRYYFKQATLEEGRKARCGIVFVHGLRDHAGTHDFFFKQLTDEGCHILSFDLLGHGYSPGERCSIEDYNEHVLLVWHSIVRAIRRHFPLHLPLVLMGYSYGFSLVVHALTVLDNANKQIGRILQSRVDLVVGMSPALKITHDTPVTEFFSPVLAFLSRHIVNIPYKPIEASNISDDEVFLSTIETDEKVFKGHISVHTAANVLAAGREAMKRLPDIPLPFLLIFGGDDFVLPPTAEELKHRDDITVRILKGGKHNIFDGDNLFAGRTLEIILQAIDEHCWIPEMEMDLDIQPVTINNEPDENQN
ncbi:MAG: alpha/beta fold hydrolase [Gammaproteobacteria bacterium]